MPDSLDDWIARAEKAKNLAAVQANYGLDGVGNANGKSAASTQLKFLNIIGDIDPRLVRPRTQDSRPAYSTPSSQTCGPSLLTAALKRHDSPIASSASTSSSSSDRSRTSSSTPQKRT
ncbi:hypothetical protein EXIGLDRAFT_721430 [Exidia glandulosa HHB12029]|uniref:Uncharacterized protein n=1 Tax=Exidia glandulosa HHB12029 TaxID=1314781 RepID=A0A165FRE2_EXIGL|nr:hypothetical protein EXIGLDRAFT_721430 [Exidia glandulosa HHB12029]